MSSDTSGGYLLPPLSPQQWRTAPLMGLLSTAVATALAISLVPVDVYDTRSLMMPALCITAGLLIVPLICSVQSPFAWLHPVHIVVASPVYWLLLDVLQAAYELPGIRQHDVRLAFLSIGAFATFVWMGALLRPGRIPQRLSFALFTDFSAQHLFGVILLSFILAFLRFAIPARFDIEAMTRAFTVGRWSAPWARGELGGWDSFLNHMAYFGYVLPALTILIARKTSWVDFRTLTALILTLIIALLESTGGGRRILGVMAGSGVTVWFLSAYRPQVRHIVVAGIACCVVLVVLQAVLLFRNVGLAAVIAGERPDTSFKHLHVDDNFLRLCQVVQIIPNEHDYVTWRYPAFLAARPVPRVFWPGKPVSPGFNLAEYLGAKGVSYSMSIIGEFYMCGGLLGCCTGGLFMGWMARTLSTVLLVCRRPGALIVFGVGMLAMFAGMRSGIDLILMNYGLLAWVVLAWLYRQVRPATF